MLWVLRACASFRFQFCALKLAPSKREFLASNSLLSTRGLKSNAIVVEYVWCYCCVVRWEPTGNTEEFSGPNYQNAWRESEGHVRLSIHTNSIPRKQHLHKNCSSWKERNDSLVYEMWKWRLTRLAFTICFYFCCSEKMRMMEQLKTIK